MKPWSCLFQASPTKLTPDSGGVDFGASEMHSYDDLKDRPD